MSELQVGARVKTGIFRSILFNGNGEIILDLYFNNYIVVGFMNYQMEGVLCENEKNLTAKIRGYHWSPPLDPPMGKDKLGKYASVHYKIGVMKSGINVRQKFNTDHNYYFRVDRGFHLLVCSITVRGKSIHSFHNRKCRLDVIVVI